MIIDLLRSDGSIVVNKKLAHAIGINAAILYSEIISKQIYFKNREELTNDGFFFNTAEDMEKDTALSKFQQSQSIKKLVELKLIFQDNRGLPQKRYFKVNEDEQFITKLLANSNLTFKSEETKLFKEKNLTFDSEETKQIEVKKLDGNNTNINNSKENKTKEEKKKDIYIPFSEIIDYLNSICETKYRVGSRKTKEHITARWNEGYVLEDFKTVIENKKAEWTNTEYEKYLRPETLFGPKFESYLNQKIKKAEGEKSLLSGGKPGRRYSAELPEFNYKQRHASNVLLAQSEYDSLVEKFKEVRVKRMIEVLNHYKVANGKKYKSDYDAILSWVADKVLKEKDMSDRSIEAQELADQYDLGF